MKRSSFLLALALTLGSGAEAQQTLPQAPDPLDIIGKPNGAPISGAALDEKARQVGALLRCPVCQGLSVADSPATMAVEMRVQVKELLAKGYDADQTLTYFEKSYGEFVRLQPPLRGVNWLVWLAPVLGLLGGGLVVWRVMAARSAEPAATPSVDPEALPDDPRLAPYVLRVRELAYGWPGGVRPKAGV